MRVDQAKSPGLDPVRSSWKRGRLEEDQFFSSEPISRLDRQGITCHTPAMREWLSIKLIPDGQGMGIEDHSPRHDGARDDRHAGQQCREEVCAHRQST